MENNFNSKKNIMQIVNNFLRLLNVIHLENDGVIVHFNKIKLKKTFSPNNYNVYKQYQLLDTIVAKEARIDYVAKEIDLYLSFFDLMYNETYVEVNGFRLKSNADWLIKNNDEPNNILQYLAWPCNADCKFCFQKGNPDILKRAQKTYSTIYELDTRLKYYKPDKNQALFNQAWMDIDEILTHPKIKEYLLKLREKTRQSIQITTNGITLTEEMILFLKSLEPVRISISLNSIKPETRKSLMGDAKPHIAINSLPLLAKNKIEYAVTIAFWPTLNFDEVYETIKYAQEHDAFYVRIYLPGYSKWMPKAETFNHHAYWGEIITFIRKIRKDFAIPIICVPSMYEEWFFKEYEQKAKVLGIVKNSPAYNKLLIEDEIISVNSIPTKTKVDAYSILQRSSHLLKQAYIEVKRKEEILYFDLKEDFSIENYPYIANFTSPFGIFVGFSLSFQNIEFIYIIAKIREAQKVVLLSSLILKPFIENMIEQIAYKYPEIKITVVIVDNEFLGGNIIIGSMLVVDDYIKTIKKWVKNNETPDLILLPETPFGNRGSGWQRDMLGKNYKYIEREIKIPVELLPFTSYVPY